jgi:hypothetical protein
MSSRLRQWLFLLVWLGSFSAAAAADSLKEVQQRIQVDQTRQYQYREVRKLQLLEQDWVASGEMIIAPDQIAIHQQAPKSVLISINLSRMLYLDLDSGTRRVRPLNQRVALPGLQPLMQLFHSDDRESLERTFDIRFDERQRRWHMALTPKDGASATREMEISGVQGDGPDQIVLLFKNGDSTQWSLRLLANARAADQALQRLLQQASE